LNLTEVAEAETFVNHMVYKQLCTYKKLDFKEYEHMQFDPETNKQLFTVADIDALGQKSAKALDRIFEIAQRLSKIGANDVEEMAKNS